ncbi:MAG: CapA family protein [Spirochaetia bacterium]|nr:CapA family protein [Spirochaetia bacterium]
MKTTAKQTTRAACVIILSCILSGCAATPPKITAVEPKTVSFCAAGDVMLDRGVEKRISEKGKEFIFENTSGFIKSRSLAFCNLECPVSKRGERKEGGFAFRADPANLDIIINGGFDVVSLANNHLHDYGEDALGDTLQYLEEKKLAWAGAGKNREEARACRIIEVNGIKVAFLAELHTPFIVTEVPSDPELPQVSQARGMEAMAQAITTAAGSADVVIVSFHWGHEYTNTPLKFQRRYARACIDAGADLVIGHHPHVMQPVEIYNGKPILYSLGNLVFDQFGDMTSKTFIFACEFLKDGTVKNGFLTPVKIRKNRPEFARGKEAAGIRDTMMSISKKFGTKFAEKDGRLYLEGLR